MSLQFKYGDHDIDVAYRFSYLGIVFATGEVFQEMENTITGQLQNGSLLMNKYLQSFVSLKPSLIFSIFDKLISLILHLPHEAQREGGGGGVEFAKHFCRPFVIP